MNKIESIDTQGLTITVQAGVTLIVYKICTDCDSTFSAEHGVGITKKSYLSFSRTDEEIQLTRHLKSLFDPTGILNRDRIV